MENYQLLKSLLMIMPLFVKNANMAFNNVFKKYSFKKIKISYKCFLLQK